MGAETLRREAEVQARGKAGGWPRPRTSAPGTSPMQQYGRGRQDGQGGARHDDGDDGTTTTTTPPHTTDAAIRHPPDVLALLLFYSEAAIYTFKGGV